MMQRLEESKNMEAEERVRLEEEIRMKQEEVSTIYQQVCIPEIIYHFLSILLLLPNPKKFDIIFISRSERKKMRTLHCKAKWRMHDINMRYE